MSEVLRVAVTGGSGRVGQYIVRELISRGHSVINIDRRMPADGGHGSKFVFAEVRRRDQIQPILEQVDAVIHTAEIPSHYAPLSPDELFSVNTSGTAVVIQTAADLKLKRAIYTSSCQAYGMWGGPTLPPPVRLPFDETHPLQPQNIYALGKQVNETYCQYVSKNYGLSIAIFRLPGVIMHPEMTFRWMESRTDRVEDMATQIHPTDIARAYADAIEHPRPGCEAYHFSAAEVTSLVPYPARLKKYHPDFPPLPADWPDFKSPMILDKAREHFGWEPKWSVQDEYRKWKATQPK